MQFQIEIKKVLFDKIDKPNAINVYNTYNF